MALQATTFVVPAFFQTDQLIACSVGAGSKGIDQLGFDRTELTNQRCKRRSTMDEFFSIVLCCEDFTEP